MAKIINLGSVCVDHVYRVPALAGPGETIASFSHSVFAGGKGLNQSIAAARAGAEVTHIGAVGDDGAFLVELLAKDGVDTECLRTRPGETSGHAVIQVDPSGQNSIVISAGTNRQLKASDLEAIKNVSAPGDWLLLQNETNLLAEAIELASALSMRIAMNVAPADERCVDLPLGDIDLLIVNAHEAAILSGDSEPTSAIVRLSEVCPKADIVLTLGKDGLLFHSPQESGSVPARSVKSVDETAAGDAFTGFLLAQRAADEKLSRALEVASAAGALATTREGAAPSMPRLEEVLRFVDEASR